MTLIWLGYTYITIMWACWLYAVAKAKDDHELTLMLLSGLLWPLGIIYLTLRRLKRVSRIR
jgi:hypothetical protein